MTRNTSFPYLMPFAKKLLVIAGFGLFLFEMSIAPGEGVATAPYPPFGLATVLFAGLALGPVGRYTKKKVDFALILSCQESAS
jgi:hypothetical protein